MLFYTKEEFLKFNDFERRNAISDLILYLKFKEPQKAQYIHKNILKKIDENYYQDSNELFIDLIEVLDGVNSNRKNKFQNLKFLNNLSLKFLNKLPSRSLKIPKEISNWGVLLIYAGIGTIFFASFATFISVVVNLQDNKNTKVEKKSIPSAKQKIYSIKKENTPQVFIQKSKKGKLATLYENEGKCTESNATHSGKYESAFNETNYYCLVNGKIYGREDNMYYAKGYRGKIGETTYVPTEYLEYIKIQDEYYKEFALENGDIYIYTSSKGNSNSTKKLFARKIFRSDGY